MIRKAWFREFRALREVDVDLEGLTVFVGPNGSGKTSVLEGIHSLLQVAQRPIQDVLQGPWRADRLRNTRATEPMVLGASFEGHPARVLQLTVTPRVVADEVERPYLASMRATIGPVERSWNPASETLREQKVARELMEHDVERALFLRLSASALAAPSYADTEEPVLAADGEGLASVIADLASNAPEIRDAITAAVQKVVPAVRRIRTERAAVYRTEDEVFTVGTERGTVQRQRKYWGSRVVLDTVSGEGIPLQSASEGTVLTLGLMTVLYGRRRPRTLLMDDLDRALHPSAQQELVAVLRAAMTADPELQVVATSHSPFLLDALEHAEVRLTTLADDGSVLCGALRDHPAFDQWKALVKPGELWTSELEDWLRKTRSTAA